MIEKHYIELINGEIDGVNSSDESSELRRYLETNPEARQYFDDLTDIGRTVAEMTDLDPPRRLRQTILSCVAARRPVPRGESLIGRIRERLMPQAQPRYAFAFVTGVLVGFLVFAVSSLVMLRGVGERADRLYGTLTTGLESTEILSSECIPFELPHLYGGACIEHSTCVLQANLDLSTDEEVRVVFEYDDLVRFEELKALGQSDYTMQVEGNRAELKHMGDCAYVLVFSDGRRSGSPIRLTVTDQEGVIFDKSIIPRGE
jgi:hypothetical protein